MTEPARVWMVRLGRHGEAEDHAIETGELAPRWEIPGLDLPASREVIVQLLQETYPDKKPRAVRNWAAQLNQFVNRVADGDICVSPFKTTGQIGIGRFTGEFYLTDANRPARKVNWVRSDLPREVLNQDLLFSLGASQTICEVRRNNAAVRFATVITKGSDPGDSDISLPNSPVPTDDGGEETDIVNLEQIARDQIERHIASHFSGHDFTRLIAAILRAKGFQTQVSPPGADQSIDIVAGQGGLGFDGPRLVVQVKSGDLVADQPALQSLIGCVQDAHAEHGLLVSWSGFTSPVRKRVNELYFRVRLWGRPEILDALFGAYERLSEELRAELPLQRVWTMVAQDDV